VALTSWFGRASDREYRLGVGEATTTTLQLDSD
jgi:hypothetical protein